MEKEKTPEEIKEFLNKQVAFYQERLPMLRLRSEYETLVTNIEEMQYKRLVAIKEGAMLAQEAEEAVKRFKEAEAANK